jgi:hypothetical protein
MVVVEMKGREEVTKSCGRAETESKLLILVGNDDDDIAIILI